MFVSATEIVSLPGYSIKVSYQREIDGLSCHITYKEVA